MWFLCLVLLICVLCTFVFCFNQTIKTMMITHCLQSLLPISPACFHNCNRSTYHSMTMLTYNLFATNFFGHSEGDQNHHLLWRDITHQLCAYNTILNGSIHNHSNSLWMTTITREYINEVLDGILRLAEGVTMNQRQGIRPVLRILPSTDDYTLKAPTNTSVNNSLEAGKFMITSVNCFFSLTNNLMKSRPSML